MGSVHLTCEQCGKHYTRAPSQAENSRFCTRPCLQQWLNVNVRTRHKAPWLSELNKQPGRNAKVSRNSAAKRSRKRRALKQPRKYKKVRGQHEHRRIAERIAGRKLSSHELVHHVDENRLNNDPANLVIGVSKSWHAWVHSQLRKEVRPTVLSIRERKGQIPGMRYKFKTKPYRHQVSALKKLIFRRGGALFAEMGTG